MHFIAVVMILFLLYQYWKKRQGEPRVKKSRGTVIDVEAFEQEDWENEALPYKKCPYLQERAARLFFEGVKLRLQPYAVDIYPQVDAGKLLYVPRSEKNFGRYYHRIAGKCVDFVLCDRKTMEPLVAILLDSIHTAPEAAPEGDFFIDRAFQAAGMPLVHFLASEDGYVWDTIMGALYVYIGHHTL